MAAKESTYGQAATTGFLPYEFNSETLALVKTVVQGKGIHAGGLYNRAARRIVSNYAAAGQINMDLPTRYLHPWLNQMMGASANLTEMATSGVYQAVYAPGSLAGKSLTLQKGVPSVDGSTPNPFTYTGVKFTDWTVQVATGAIASLQLTTDARNEIGGVAGANLEVPDGINSTVPALQTWAEDPTNSVFHFREAAVYTGGTATTTSGVTTVSGSSVAGYVRSASVKCAYHLDTSRYFLGSNGFKAEPIENNWRDVTGTMTVDWVNAENMYSAFVSDAPTTLELRFTGPVEGTSGTNTALLSILIPNIQLDGESPKISGPAVVQQNVSFTGLDDGTNNPVQITYQTLDAS